MMSAVLMINFGYLEVHHLLHTVQGELVYHFPCLAKWSCFMLYSSSKSVLSINALFEVMKIDLSLCLLGSIESFVLAQTDSSIILSLQSP